MEPEDVSISWCLVMSAADDLIDRCRVSEGKKVQLKDYDPNWAGDPEVPKNERKRDAEQSLTQDVSELAEAQERLYAADSWSVLMIFQAMDAAGKDGTIKHVMSGVNPQGCQVFSFKKPSAEDLDHNFLWRYTRALPERGRLGIFNRSYYEEVLVVRVHPELIKAARIPNVKIDDDFWADRYEDINALERHLTRNGTVVLKFFLCISKDEQRKEPRRNKMSKLQLFLFHESGIRSVCRMPLKSKGFDASSRHCSLSWTSACAVNGRQRKRTRLVGVALVV